MELNYPTVHAAWPDLVNLCVTRGERVTPRGLPNREIPERVHVIIDRPCAFPLFNPGRQFRHAITAVEGLSLVGQVSVPELVTDRVKSFRPFLNDSIFHGAYGPRASGSVFDVVDLLHRDPDSRQAVITLYDSRRDLNRPKLYDVPCTVAIQFLARRGVLDMWVMMRSNDVWRGTPYDFGQFVLLQSAIAQGLGMGLGTYTHSAGSLHLYDSDYTKAEDLPLDGPMPGETIELRWGADRIGDIASRARRLLLGHALEDPTPLETWLARSLAS